METNGYLFAHEDGELVLQAAPLKAFDPTPLSPRGKRKRPLDMKEQCAATSERNDIQIRHNALHDLEALWCVTSTLYLTAKSKPAFQEFNRYRVETENHTRRVCSRSIFNA